MRALLPVYLISLLSVISLGACASNRASQPGWVDTMIAGFEAEPVANPPQRIVRYRYGDQTVYYVPARCCDRPSALYDASGSIICEPDGGLTGRGDGRCSDFRDLRRDEMPLWSDSRSR